MSNHRGIKHRTETIVELMLLVGGSVTAIIALAGVAAARAVSTL